jgi:hypothetical protein
MASHECVRAVARWKHEHIGDGLEQVLVTRGRAACTIRCKLELRMSSVAPRALGARKTGHKFDPQPDVHHRIWPRLEKLRSTHLNSTQVAPRCVHKDTVVACARGIAGPWLWLSPYIGCTWARMACAFASRSDEDLMTMSS